jgi:hypothetical protein
VPHRPRWKRCWRETPATWRFLRMPATSTTPSRRPIRIFRKRWRTSRITAHHVTGTTAAAIPWYGKGLYPKPPDLRLAETQKLSDGELFWIIENGIRFTGMPAFGGSHGSQDDWKLVLFLRHLPQLTMEERVEMERDNPKGPPEHEKDHH